MSPSVESLQTRGSHPCGPVTEAKSSKQCAFEIYKILHVFQFHLLFFFSLVQITDRIGELIASNFICIYDKSDLFINIKSQGQSIVLLAKSMDEKCFYGTKKTNKLFHSLQVDIAFNIWAALPSVTEPAGAELHCSEDPLQHDDGGGTEARDHLRVQGPGPHRRRLRELRRRDRTGDQSRR